MTTDIFPRWIVILLLAAWMMVGGTAPATAQNAATGAVAGVVVDGETGDPLPGANVSLEGTTTGTATDLNGRYKMAGLEPGTYNVVFSFIGFQQTTVTGVEVDAGQATTLDITLNAQTEQLDEVIVTAEAARDSEAGLLRQRQNAAAVSDAISAEAIGQSGAGDAAAAMKRVTGASVVGGKYVYVRGLGGRYSNTQLNGIQIPSSDPDRNSVQFDLFQSDALDNVVTQKTFTPDEPGNFSGGLVNINTKSFPENFSLKFSSSVGFNTQTHFNDKFLTQTGGGLDFLGIDDGTRDIPNPLRGITIQDIPSVEEVNRAIQDDNPDNDDIADRLDRMSDAFNNNMGPITSTAPLNQSYAFSVGNQFDLLGRPMGYVASLSYGRTASFYDDGFTGRYEAPSSPGGPPDPTILVNDTEGSDEVNVGGVANLNYKVAQNHQFSGNFMYTRSGEQRTRFQIGGWPDEFGPGSESQIVNRTIAYTERRLASGQLRGEHYLSDLAGTTVEWTAAYSDTRQEEPDKRLFPSSVQVDADGDRTLIANASGFPFPSRIFRDLTETSANMKLDITIPFSQWSGLKSKVKVGGAFKQDERDFSETFFSMVPGDGVSFNGVDGNEQRYFADENTGIINIIDTTLPSGASFRRPVYGNYVQLNVDENNDYVGERTVAAGYMLFELPITGRLDVVTGARLESTVQEVGRPGEDFAGQIDELDVLPALNVKYALQDNMNLRAAATRTLARPSFREFAPFSLFDTDIFDFIVGNPELQRTLITNLDLRWEWFVRPGEIFAASAFYKNMENPIESALLGSSNGQKSWANVDNADVYGVEVEVRTRLDRFTSALQYLSLGANASLVESVVDVPASELADNEQDNQTRSLEGQSPYTMNADLTYDNPETGTTTGLYFNIFGERLSSVGLFATPNAFEQPFAQLDFTLSQRLWSNWSVNLSVDNILNDKFEQTVENESGSYVYQRYSEGRTYKLGFSYQY
jgi:TonB-dependent receptor